MPLHMVYLMSVAVKYLCIQLLIHIQGRLPISPHSKQNGVIPVFLPDLEFSILESWSRDLFLQVLVSVLVLEPSSLGLGLGTC